MITLFNKGVCEFGKYHIIFITIHNIYLYTDKWYILLEIEIWVGTNRMFIGLVNLKGYFEKHKIAFNV